MGGVGWGGGGNKLSLPPVDGAINDPCLLITALPIIQLDKSYRISTWKHNKLSVAGYSFDELFVFGRNYFLLTCYWIHRWWGSGVKSKTSLWGLFVGYRGAAYWQYRWTVGVIEQSGSSNYLTVSGPPCDLLVLVSTPILPTTSDLLNPFINPIPIAPPPMHNIHCAGKIACCKFIIFIIWVWSNVSGRGKIISWLKPQEPRNVEWEFCL